MSIKTFKRYENKYLIDEYEYRVLTSKISKYMNPDAYCQDGEVYTIYNVYYDTPEDELIKKSLSKPYYKEKLRLRSYALPQSEDDKIFLELKKKIGSVVSKRRARLSVKEARDFVERGIKPQTDDYLNHQVIEEIAYFLSQNKVKEKVVIAYERNAYFGKQDKEFRLTFDSNINTRRTNLELKNGNIGKPLLNPDEYLMEVKISGAMPIWLAKELSKLKIYSRSFSKYGNEYKQKRSN